jgi:ribosomal protein S18 acetylase RimI-like enzyme
VAALRRLLPQLSAAHAGPDAASLAKLLANPGVTVLVAHVGGNIVGTATLVVLPLLSQTRARIEDVVVDEAYRGRGVGATLTREAIRRAGVAGAAGVDLTTRPSREAANAMYQRLGFLPRETQAYRYELQASPERSA